MLNEILKDKSELWKMTNVSFNGNQILGMTLNGQYGFFDLCKHLNTSLKSACASFKVSSQIAKTELNHVIMQRLFDQLGEEKYVQMLKNSPETGAFKKYILNDVASLSALYFIYEFTFLKIKAIGEIMKSKQMHSF